MVQTPSAYQYSVIPYLKVKEGSANTLFLHLRNNEGRDSESRNLRQHLRGDVKGISFSILSA